MFPIRDEIPSRRRPVVTWSLIALNVALFLYQLTLPESALASLFYRFGLVPARISDPAWALAAGLPPGGYLGFLSGMFLHGGFLHLLFNMWTLWIFGDNVEDRMGRGRYLFFYLTCGVAASVVQWLTNPASTIPTIGASGAIAGVMGGYFLLFPHSRVLTLVPIFFYPLFLRIPAIVYLGLWFVLQLLSGTTSLGRGPDTGGVAFWAHVGGFAAGFLLVRPLSRREPEQLPGFARHFVMPHNPPFRPLRSGRLRD
ncbi:MAG: rhomboid family intramembrane serine protease [Thermoanaerobaculia bacterium]